MGALKDNMKPFKEGEPLSAKQLEQMREAVVALIPLMPGQFTNGSFTVKRDIGSEDAEVTPAGIEGTFYMPLVTIPGAAKKTYADLPAADKIAIGSMPDATVVWTLGSGMAFKMRLVLADGGINPVAVPVMNGASPLQERIYNAARKPVVANKLCQTKVFTATQTGVNAQCPVVDVEPC